MTATICHYYDKIGDALEAAKGQEGDQARATLAEIARLCERALQLKGVDDQDIKWFNEKWVDASARLEQAPPLTPE